MKIILILENALSQQHSQNFNSDQRVTLQRFLENPNDFTTNAIKSSEYIHADGCTERWKITLDKNFDVFVDCSIPAPWSSSEDVMYYGTCALVGYDLGEDKYFMM